MVPGRSAVLATAALLTALSFAAMALQVPFPLLPQAYRYDLADVPALVAAFTLGPGPAVAVVLCRNLLHGLLVQPEVVGHLMNAAASGSMVAVAGLAYMRVHTRLGALWSLVLGSLAATLVMIPLNLLVLPSYLGLPFPDVVRITAFMTVPFNLSKGALTGLATWLLYKKVSGRLPHYRCPGARPREHGPS